MKKISFTKMVASGNDFVIIKGHQVTKSPGHRELAKRICNRKYGIGADGLLVLEKSKKADIRMRIFNADGSEAQMCGNGARCAALYMKAPRHHVTTSPVTIETKAGLIKSEVDGDRVRIKLTNPKNIKEDIPLRINNRLMRVNFINTGVPHAVIFVEGLDKIDVKNLGSLIRYHRLFAPGGTNVDFVEALGPGAIKIRTYERGVEDETLACGTGSVAAALITNYKLRFTNYALINVHTRSGEVLKVYFNKKGSKFNNVWLQGKAKIVYQGEYYV